MFPIYEVKPKGDRWVLNEVYAFSTKEHSKHDIEADAVAEKLRIEREMEQHFQNLRQGPPSMSVPAAQAAALRDLYEKGRIVEASAKFGSKKSKELIEQSRPAMIVKVQLSLFTGHPHRRMIVYNEDQSVHWEGDATQEVVDVMGHEGDIRDIKKFFHAHIDEDGKVALDGEAPWQDW